MHPGQPILIPLESSRSNRYVTIFTMPPSLIVLATDQSPFQYPGIHYSARTAYDLTAPADTFLES
ncbi:hypothetical protein DSUL_260007 [Desulfovibrionales bacterium]